MKPIPSEPPSLARPMWRATVAERHLQDGQVLTTRSVVAPTGSFGHPYLPKLWNQAAFPGRILHSKAYKNTVGFEGRRIVVVGAGNSAIQIAVELARVAEVTLATLEPIRFRAQRILGLDVPAHPWVGCAFLDEVAWLRSAWASGPALQRRSPLPHVEPVSGAPKRK